MRNEPKMIAGASEQPAFFMREGVDGPWHPIRAAMVGNGYAATLEVAKGMADASAFWSLSPLYIGRRDEDGTMQIVCLKRTKQRGSGYWLAGDRAHAFEIKGEL